MVLPSAAVDGVTNIVAGWTDQALTPYSSGLESYGGGTLGIASTPAGNGYLAWSMIPEDAIATNTHTSTTGFLNRVVAATGGSCAHMDFVVTTQGTISNAVFALYNGPSFAVGPLVWTANASALITGTGVFTVTWNGASSPAAINLQAGAVYWVYSEMTTSVATVLAGSLGASAASMNPNLTATASFADNAMSLAAGAPTSLTASTTLTPQTSWVTSAQKLFFGLRA